MSVIYLIMHQKVCLQCLPNDEPSLMDDAKDLRKRVTRASCLACKPPHHNFEVDQAISYEHMCHTHASFLFS